VSGQLAEVQPLGAHTEQTTGQFRLRLRGKQVRQRAHNVWYYHTIVWLYQTKQRAACAVADHFRRHRGIIPVGRGSRAASMSPPGRLRGHGNGKGETGAVLRERPTMSHWNAGLRPGLSQRLEPRRIGDRRSGATRPSSFGEDEREIG
jgi:hypothetical protein